MAPLLSIRQISECFVRPMEVVEESKKPYHLSAFELFHLSQCYVQVGLMFNKVAAKDDGEVKAFVERLKESLASTLTHFYPLAGQLVTEIDEDKHTSYVFLDCNKGPGAKLIHAALDGTTVSDIVSPHDKPTTVDFFFDLGHVPICHAGHDIPLLTVQVTELVDGVFLGVSMNQTAADDAGCWHFFTSLSDKFKSNNLTLSRPPMYKDRLYPRECGPKVTLPFIHLSEVVKKQNVDGPLMEVVFHFTSQKMAELEAKMKKEFGLKTEVSSFEALCAVVWRSITRARNKKADENTSCAVVSNVRTVIDPPLTEDYFGNFINPVIKHLKVRELLGMTLEETALLLHQSNAEQLTDKFVRNECVQWIKAPIFLPPGLPEPGFVVITGSPEEDVYGIEFGMGKAVAVYTCSNKHDGKVVAHPGKEGKGSVSLEICLFPDGMKALEEDKEFASLVSSKS